VNQSSNDVEKKSLCTGTISDMWSNKKPQFIICLILFISSISLIIVFLALQLSVIYSYNYAIIIDAGSTGTRAFLYEWKDEPGAINDIVTEKTSAQAGRLQDVYQNENNNALLTCISEVIKSIPQSYLTKPSIFLAATAGMRLFQEENPALTKRVFEDIKKLFTKKGWNTRFVGIITGEIEAVSGWITANFLKDTIGKKKTAKSGPTIGALDLGGASTQIAFESNQGTTNVELFGDKYSLYAVSYLCYGANMFYVKYMSSIAINSTEVAYNCLLRNSKTSLEDDSKTCRAKGSEHIDFNTFAKPVVSNSLKCREQINDVLRPHVATNIVDKNQKYVAVSSFYYYQQFLKTNFKIDNTFKSFIDATDKFCTSDYNDLKALYPLSFPYSGKFCFTGNYIIALLQLYGFDDASFTNIEFTNNIKSLSVGWNLGYMIEKTRYIPDSIIYRLNNIVFVVVISLAAVILVFTMLLFFYAMWGRRQKIDNINV